jgi:hypothetical protein
MNSKEPNSQHNEFQNNFQEMYYMNYNNQEEYFNYNKINTLTYNNDFIYNYNQPVNESSTKYKQTTFNKDITTPFESYKRSINNFNSQSDVKLKQIYQPAYLTNDKFQRNNFDYESLSDEEIGLHCHIIVKDQAGCRFLQKKIEEIKSFANDILFPNVNI